MIILSEVAKKIQAILNGSDTEVGASGTVVQKTNPAPYYFIVQTEGLHLDSIADKDKHENFIPVFISTMGGNNNPVKGLKQSTCSIPITFYFPVRFKETFFDLYDFLGDAFIGQYLTYGTISGKAVSNISIPQYGEIQNLDLQQFEKWVNENFRIPLETHEMYLSMTVTLFLSSAASDFVFGNEIDISLTYKISTTTYEDKKIVFDAGALQSNSQAQSEQPLGENESQGLPFGVAYSTSFKMFYQDKAFYNKLVELWFAGTLQNLDITLSLKIRNNTFTRKCYVQSVVLPIQKGDVLAFTITFLKKIVEEEPQNPAITPNPGTLTPTPVESE